MRVEEVEVEVDVARYPKERKLNLLNYPKAAPLP